MMAATNPAPWQRGERVANLRAARGNRCEVCGRSGDDFNFELPVELQFAHLRPTALDGRGRGQTQRYRDIVAHPDAYRLVCKGACHRQVDQEVRAAARAAKEGRRQ
jgi:hypothetical protein